VLAVGAIGAGALSGAATALAFPPADLGPLAFVSLTPLAAVFMHARPKTAAAASAAFGAVFFGMLLRWIRLFGPEAYVGLIVVETAFVVAVLAIGQWVMRRLRPRRPALAALVFPLAFLAGEYLRSHLPLGGFGWGGLGYSQHENLPLLHLASYTGVWGISLVLAGTATLAERALTAVAGGRARWAIACIAGGIVLALAPGLLPVPDPAGAHARIAAVQGSLPEPSSVPETVPPSEPGVQVGERPALDGQLALTRTLAGRHWSLVVWPESSVDVDPFLNRDVHDLLVDSARAIRAPMLVGAKTDEPDDRFRNTSLLFSADGQLVDRYDKQHFVPFGEYVPFRKLLEPLVSELRRVPRDGVPGTRPTVFTLPEGRFAAAICFESTFPGLVREFVDRGAGLLVVSTNDSSFERTAAARQHLAFAQLRAAEHRMWVVQAALTGITSFVEPSGRAVSRTGLFQKAVVEGDVRFASARTVYGHLGDWLPAVCLLALAAGIVAAARLPRPGAGSLHEVNGEKGPAAP
jgi:apolipoprotein N-acyltransferase